MQTHICRTACEEPASEPSLPEFWVEVPSHPRNSSGKKPLGTVGNSALHDKKLLHNADFWIDVPRLPVGLGLGGSRRQHSNPDVVRQKAEDTVEYEKVDVHRNAEDEILEDPPQRNPRLQMPQIPVVTPRVARLAPGFFDQELQVVGNKANSSSAACKHDNVSNDCIQMHSGNPQHIEWLAGAQDTPNIWTTVNIDGVVYAAGDIIIVEKGHDTNSVRQSHAARSQAYDEVANTKWFCQIQYMFQARPTANHGQEDHLSGGMFHALWLQHASQTLLEESADQHELFYLNECDDLPLECIYSHCKAHILDPEEDSPIYHDPHSLQYQIGLTWDSEQSALIQPCPDSADAALRHCTEDKQCISCGLLAMAIVQSTWTTLPDRRGISRLADTYHLRDFVYLKSQDALEGIYNLGQIRAFEYSSEGIITVVEVQLYGRYNDVVKASNSTKRPRMSTDERRLFRSRKRVQIDPMCIDGKAFVYSATAFARPDDQELEEWLHHDDHFFVDLCTISQNPASIQELKPLLSIHVCEACMSERCVQMANEQRLLKKFGKLRGLELFAGAGGLSTGFALSGFIDTKWAVEYAPSAAATYRHNHPDTIVYDEDSNLLLKHAIETANGMQPQPLWKGSRALATMPKPGEVDFIFGGPPCQGFSNMNHHRKSDDIRNTLVCNMLSYVEFYQPSYFLLENVLGLLTYNLRGRRMGVVKFIIRALSSLGYQVHFKVLQAGQYGAPQARRRVIFWGAKRSVPLPQFPAPTHVFKRMHLFNLETGDVLNPASRVHPADVRLGIADYHQFAPHTAVTVDDAISDLPPFDWVNPHVKLAETVGQRREREARKAQGIEAFDATAPYPARGTYVGFTEAANYASDPLNRYQILMRKAAQKEVFGHYTSRYPAPVVERVVNVPLSPNANHKDLPRMLVDTRLMDRTNDSGYNTLYGRIDGEGHFATALTTVRPNSKGGRLLHPHQRRVVTMRECARAQGFPDNYEFLSESRRPGQHISDQHRQIGNAVPIPLALALGKELGKALIKMWSQQEKREIAAREQSPEA